MCDLFALSATKDYSAPEFLPIFAVQAKTNMDGWGIGFFRKHHVFKDWPGLSGAELSFATFVFGPADSWTSVMLIPLS